METVVRVAVIYIALLLFFRVIGKRELSQMSSFELVTLMLIPEIVSQAIQHDDYSLINALVGVATIFTLVVLTSVLTHLSRRVAEFTDGRPTVLVREGKLVEDALDLERIQPEEIFSSMHQVGLESLAQVKWGILEPDGKISIVPFGPPPQAPPQDETYVA